MQNDEAVIKVEAATPLAGSSASSDGRYALQFHIYGGLNEVTQDLKAYIKPGDSFVISSIDPGDWSGIRRKVQTLNAEFPGYPIYFRTSGWVRVRDAIKIMPPDLIPAFSAILHVYEPQDESLFGPYPPQGPHDFQWVLDQYRQVTNLAHQRGIDLWAVPSGRYVPERDLAKYNWDYGVLGTVVDRVIVQTQGSCKAGKMPATVRSMNQQFANAGVTTPWMPMTAVGLIGDVANSVPADESWDCILKAEQQGLHEHAHQWWDMQQAMKLMRIRASQ